MIKGYKRLQGHETLCETEKSLDMYETMSIVFFLTIRINNCLYLAIFTSTL